VVQKAINCGADFHEQPQCLRSNVGIIALQY
jgi:hypothetical protein